MKYSLRRKDELLPSVSQSDEGATDSQLKDFMSIANEWVGGTAGGTVGTNTSWNASSLEHLIRTFCRKSMLKLIKPRGCQVGVVNWSRTMMLLLKKAKTTYFPLGGAGRGQGKAKNVAWRVQNNKKTSTWQPWIQDINDKQWTDTDQGRQGLCAL